MSYWEGEQLVLRNYATSRTVVVPARATELLDFFGEWRRIEELMALLSMSRREARALLEKLLDATLLQRSDRKLHSDEAAMAAWAPWNPAAGFFHTATRNLKFVDFFEGAKVLDRKARTDPPPPVVKRYRGAPRRALPRVSKGGELPEVLLARRTWRQFDRNALTLADLGTLLGLTNGVQHWAAVSGHGKLALKTSPSGGALHPLEVYICARRVDGLKPGMYHYASDRHCLELVRRHRRPARAQRYLPSQYWYEGAAVLVFFTAVADRYLWKYDYARAYRALLIEAGHQCQTFCLVATWLGLAPFCSMALADSAIEADLALDGISESVLYAAGVGVRPGGAGVRSHPKGMRPMTLRRNTSILSARAFPDSRALEPRR